MRVTVDREGSLATLRLDRPESRNALSDGLLAEIVEALHELESAEVHCVVIAGQERFFSAGADIAELSAASPVQVFLGCRARLWQQLRAIRTPIVAAVSGHCLGGGFELALACDLIVASPSARFGQPETGLGLIPGGGGSQRLVHLVGRAVAADLVLTGRRLSATEAHRLGIVARVADEGRWLDDAERLGREIAARPRIAQQLAKQVLDAALELPLGGGIAFERSAYQVALGSADAREGLTAFAEGREPVWTGC